MNTVKFGFSACLALLVAPAMAATGVASLSVTKVLAPVSPTRIAAAPVSTPSAATPQLPAAQSTIDTRLESIGMGDQVRISVFRNPELTTEARVSERGTVLFPMIGDVNLVGLTPSQAGTMIGDKLRSGKYVVNPEVTVTLMQVNSRQVSVLGNVVKPGRYPMDSMNQRLTDFLASAGGVAATGSDAVTILTNKGGKQEKIEVDLVDMFRSGDLTKNVALEPGDTIYVHKAPMVYVYGEVQKGGSFRLEPDMTVMQAIAMGGGITPRGTERGIKISRREGGSVRKIDANLTDRVRPDDVIYIRESLF